jgi:hypothetical protein
MKRNKKEKTCPCDLPIPQQIQHFIPQLKQISRAKDFKTKKKLFLQSPECLSKFISECSGALLRRDIELPIKQYAKLKPFKKNLLYLAHPKISRKQKIKTFLSKKGGQFGLIPLLGGILANTVIPFIIDKFTKH